MTDVVLRPARPTVDEGVRFARYMNQASHGLVQRLFGPRYELTIGRAYLSPGHDMSYQTAVFAELGDGEIVGMASAYSYLEHAAASDGPVLRAAGFRMVRMIPIWILGRALFSFIDTVPDGDYYLAGMAVDDAQRGKGIGSRLLDEAENRAVTLGCRRLALDVAADNEGARRLYERRGMTVDSQSPTVFLMPDQSVYRMVKVI